jgi:threonine dehydratase
MLNDIKPILLAKVYDVAKVSPLLKAERLSANLKTNIYLKREDLQLVHSFKLRGAYNKIANLTKKELQRGIITSSAGNHAQGVALACIKLGASSLIVMPKTTPSIKIEAVLALGGQVELYGDSYSDASDYCKKLAITTNRVYIHPFDDPEVIAGQGTIGREIIEQLPQASHIFVPVGGGGLLAGIALYVKTVRPDIKIIAVEPDDSNAMQLSIKAGKVIKLEHVGIFADGVAVKQVGNNTYAIAKNLVDDYITVNNDQICSAIKHIFEETRSVVEPAGALSLAGLEQYYQDHKLTNSNHAVAINSGANMSFEKLQYIAERTLLGSGKEVLFSVELKEEPGALQKFCNEIVKKHSITQFAYRLNLRNKAKIFVGIGLVSKSDKLKIEQKMAGQNYKYNDLSNDDTTKEHIRHMIGGPAPNAKNECFYNINFPERPGALQDFLQAVSGRFNISLFHYRGQGGDNGDVMIGFEARDIHSLENQLNKTGYTWQKIDNSISIKDFISKLN